MDKQQVRRLAGVVLGALEIFGLNSMFGQIIRNGYVERLLGVLRSPNPLLPESQTPLLTHYLGLPYADGLFKLATVLWANVTDGSNPALSLYAFQFGGQLVPIFLVMMVEGARSGNRNHALYYSVLWGYAMQAFGYAATMPVYAALHLFTSAAFYGSGKALAQANTLRDPVSFSLEVLVPAFSVGYLLPTLLMSWPFSSTSLHQWLGAVWQGFPLYVVIYQRVFARLVKPTLQSQAITVSRAYGWAFNVAAATQVSTYILILAARTFPGLLPHWASGAFTFSSVFAPGPFYSYHPLESMAKAMHDFFRWDQYVGSAAALVWGVSLDVTSREHALKLPNWLRLGFDILRWSALAGPGGALMRLLQRRDSAILSRYGKAEAKKL
ncbi:hypothetical protein BX600DRAFT_503427 [Xylariales sp. PMI_506]|nr:hypothetical protein BX600DRAFT_503427 [Xylariales sp. PMI_506]